MIYLQIFSAFFLLMIVISFFYKLLVKNEKQNIDIEEANLSYDELMQHSEKIALVHEITKGRHYKLIKRLDDNYNYIYNTKKQMNSLVNSKKRTVPAVEWLLDNFYIIEQITKEMKLGLKRGKLPKLPVLKNTSFTGFPRIYSIMVELISHCDSFVHYDSLVNFIKTYQKYQSLNNGELWSISFMSQIALIESIRNQCEKIIKTQEQYERAEKVFFQIETEKDNKKILEKLLKGSENIKFSLFEHLYFLARKKKDNKKLIKNIDQALEEVNLSSEKITFMELQKQIECQVTMGNAITSIRNISAINFTDIFEELSEVEKLFNNDPAEIYSKMDFESRNYYRHLVEKTAKKLNISETKVAKKIIELAKNGKNDKEKHIGYYLITKHLNENKNRHISFYIYVFSILTISTIISLFVSYYGYVTSYSKNIAVLAFFISFVLSYDIAMNVVNFFVSKFRQATMLPRLSLKEGISDDKKTMVIISALISDEEKAKAFLKNIEKYYLGNKQDNIYFGILGDLTDFEKEFKENDEKIKDIILNGIESLNEKYNKNIFYAFLRKRTYNEKQKKWMGYERKRGAISELSGYFRGVEKNTFSNIYPSDANNLKIKYIITLDADTKLPIGSAKELIGTISHPLNKAEIDSEKKVVKDGYGLMQPRVAINIESANETLFSKIFAGQGGIDPYSVAVSDVYQDLFGEGIFTGKGIFDVDAFMDTLWDSIGDNKVLSHDLLEGSYLRTALVTNIEVVDGYPSKYLSYAARLHRWVRGDWQLIPWLFCMVYNKIGQKIKNPLNIISKFKILDNLRRSLLYPFIVIYILLSVFVFGGSNLIWALFVVVTAFSSLLITTIDGVFEGNYKYYGQKNYARVYFGFKGSLYQTFLLFAFLPHLAYLSFDAIIRTLYRVFISKKNLLLWVTSADSERQIKYDIKSHFNKMIFSVLFGFAVIFLPQVKSIIWSVFSIFWILSPIIANKISKKIETKKYKCSNEEINFLRQHARKIWRFFEDVVSEKDNFLPPDNFQENPPNGIAHRTSPTNIGLYLLSVLAARDFGFIDSFEAVKRLENTMETIDKIEKWRGHLYNWYNTKTLALLRPRYISTVDSGNFIGYLITLKQGLYELLDKAIIDKSNIFGLIDTVRIENPAYVAEIFEKIDENDIFKSFKNIIASFSEKDLSENILIKNTVNKYVQNLNLVQNEKEVINLQTRIFELIKKTENLINKASFEPLYNKKMELFSIGYNVEEDRLTKSYYDLLASEARQTSYIAIAKGETEKKHWRKLGRNLTASNSYKGLVSWTGTMFEYLMPLLIIKNVPNTLLDETYKFVVQSQMNYGKKRRVPWGTSESGFFAFDINLNYQYKAFGVPELGLKHGLISDMVVAPYATLLALMVDTKSSIENMKRLKEAGAEDAYGFYEAIDYTPKRLINNQEKSIVKSYMAHHQGMGLLSLDNVVNGNIMQKRFYSDAQINCADELLEEKIPVRVLLKNKDNEKVEPLIPIKFESEEYVRVFEDINCGFYNSHILSNGRYSVFLTDFGTGYSKLDDKMISRWRENGSFKNFGTFIFIENLSENYWWSNTYAPNYCVPEKYRVVFSSHKAEFLRKDGNIETQTEITVCSEDNGEIRKINLKNFGLNDAILDITSYFELVLSENGADIAHPSFNNLFIRTEYKDDFAIIASRRMRTEGQDERWAVHYFSLLEGEKIGNIEYETDRTKFIGRNKSITNPLAIGNPLSNSVGAVLDPVCSIRCKIKVEAQKTASVAFVTAYCESKEEAISIINKYKASACIARAFELSYTRSNVEAKYLSLTAHEQECFYALLSHIAFLSPTKEKFTNEISENKLGKEALWAFGISGDLPLITVLINDKDELELVDLMLKAHEFLKMRGIEFELLFINTDEGSYIQPLNLAIKETISISHARDLINKIGGVFVVSKSNLENESYNLLLISARIVLDGCKGNVLSQLNEIQRFYEQTPEFIQIEKQYKENPLKSYKLDYYNGYGGFCENEYIITYKDEKQTPMPWCNVVSNHRFGFIVSSSGGGYTYSNNSRENKLSIWTNDAVTDELSEIIYIKDADTNEVWSATPKPASSKQSFNIKYGFGYAKFESNIKEIEQSLTMFVPKQETIKIYNLRLSNLGETKRRLILTYFLNPILGVSKEETEGFLATEVIDNGQALLIKNGNNSDFENAITFTDTSEKITSFTCDINEFFGKVANYSLPQGLKKASFSNKTGAGFGICTAFNIEIEIEPKSTKELCFMLGESKEKEQIKNICNYYKNIDNCKKAFDEIKSYWGDILSVIKVKTPDLSFDYLANGWLLYQTIACRLWARSAFYQCGGAYGFRDQLQDVLALINIEPKMTYTQILRHSAHQYIEGDVQHWWHPKIDEACHRNKGVRTRFSDDLLWLPFVTAKYVKKTKDESILNIEIPFLKDELLCMGEDERYNIPESTEERATVYEHCILAIEKSLAFGENGLPLIGSGDWNDGMNTVGNRGRGESVWLGWFLFTTISNFIDICKIKNDNEKIEKYSLVLQELIINVEKNGWDKNWYKRAFFDDGTPLGSAVNDECKIDSITQSWAVISKAAKQERKIEALNSLEKHLIDYDEGIIKLLTPPFENSALKPGYIKGYVSGVRENGGQYTHAAAWVILSYLLMGDGEKAYRLFSMINPINHSISQFEANRYKVEPYVVAADVYSTYPNIGRGGWTWYTGASGWLYQVCIEHILGFKKYGDKLKIMPCIPKAWEKFEIEYKFNNTVYNIVVENPDKVSNEVGEIYLDGLLQKDDEITLINDYKNHMIKIKMGKK